MNQNHITAISQCFGISEALATVAIEIYQCDNDVSELQSNAGGSYIWAKGMKSAPTKDELRELLAAKVLMKDHCVEDVNQSIYTYDFRREAREVVTNIVWNEWTEARITSDFYPIKLGSIVYAIDCFKVVENEETMAMTMTFRPIIEGKVIRFLQGGVVRLECDGVPLIVMLSDICFAKSSARNLACKKLSDWIANETN